MLSRPIPSLIPSFAIPHPSSYIPYPYPSSHPPILHPPILPSSSPFNINASRPPTRLRPAHTHILIAPFRHYPSPHIQPYLIVPPPPQVVADLEDIVQLMAQLTGRILTWSRPNLTLEDAHETMQGWKLLEFLRGRWVVYAQPWRVVPMACGPMVHAHGV